MIKKGLRPELKVGINRSPGNVGFERTFPLKRSWVAIAILAILAIIVSIPLVSTFKQAVAEWSQINSLFDLVAALFLSAWILGWLVAPLIIIAIAAVMLFGTEIVRARPGKVEIFLGLPFFGITTRYDVTKMRNLRLVNPPRNTGKAWRGSHMAFGYGANEVAFGSDISGDEPGILKSQIQTATGAKIRSGGALPEELITKRQGTSKPATRSSLIDSTVQATPLSLASPSTLALIIANLVPVAGSVFLGWKLSDVMVIYWAESAVFGFFNICKMAVIGRWKALFNSLFFTGHFGGFMTVHFLFIYEIFVKGSENMGAQSGELADVAQLFINLWPALIALFISHGFSFFHNFLGRKEYLGKTLSQQMSEPYSRIIFMHIVIILGGGLTMFLGGVKPVLLIVIIAKIIVDIRAHLKQHGHPPSPG